MRSAYINTLVIIRLFSVVLSSMLRSLLPTATTPVISLKRAMIVQPNKVALYALRIKLCGINKAMTAAAGDIDRFRQTCAIVYAVVRQPRKQTGFLSALAILCVQSWAALSITRPECLRISFS